MKAEHVERNIEDLWHMIAEIMTAMEENGINVPKARRAKYDPQQQKLKLTDTQQ